MKRYLKIWIYSSKCAIQSYMSSRLEYGGYFLGKLVKYIMVSLFIFSVFRFTDNLAGYSKWQVMLFFLTFNLIDSTAQALYRGVYTFKSDIRNGNFDYLVLKPINTLFYILTRKTDILDSVLLIPFICLIIYNFYQLPQFLFFKNILFYVIFFLIGMVIVTGIHILTVSLSILLIEGDNLIWIYRDTIGVSRFPSEILSAPLQFFFTYFIPVIVMVAFPVKAFLGLLGFKEIFIALGIAALFFGGSLVVWKISLKHYSSASS